MHYVLTILPTFLLRDTPLLRPVDGGGVAKPDGTCSGVGGHSMTEASWLPATSGELSSPGGSAPLPPGVGSAVLAVSDIFTLVNYF
jgi:hypothetical protein